MRKLNNKIGPDEYDVTRSEGDEGIVESLSTDCQICGERLGAREVWIKGAYFGRLCPDCEKEGRRRKRPAKD